VNDDVDRLLRDAGAWLETATFAGARDAQIKDLMAVFDARAAAAGREPLTDLEVEALFDLQHGLTAKRAFIEGILRGEIAVVERRATGEFLYDAVD